MRGYPHQCTCVYAGRGQWCEAELERRRLHQVKCLQDMYLKHMPPAFLRRRGATELALPRVEVGEAQQNQHEEVTTEAGGTEAVEMEQHATLAYVLKYELKELDEQLLA